MPKIDNFYPLYRDKLKKFVGKDLKFLEIGVQDGSSIKYWRSMSPSWNVWGLDHDHKCTGEQIVIGSQEDPEVLKQFEGFDIVIDDGGHTMKQQIETFKQLFPTVRKGGLYVIEDLHTSYWPDFKDYPISTMEFLKPLIDSVHIAEANCSRLGNRKKIDKTGIEAIEFYPSIVFIWK
ncbi:MAG: hypothetical protein EBR82_14405 [Caulobacteraceae bacterium]|nr:hypothetical protein [Caulobacteraceae bacterium]